MWLGVVLCWLALQNPSFDQAVALHRAGRLAEAEKVYRALLERGNPSIELLANLGAVLAQREQYKEAVGMYQRALRLNPKVAPLELNLGLAYFKAGEFENALRAFDRFLAMEPGNRQALQLRATCLGQMERFAEAAVAYEKLLPSEDLAVKLGYATALLRTQRAAEARQVLEPLMAGQPSAEFQMTMGQAYLIEGLYDEAEAVFQQLYERQPDLGLLRLSLGSVYWKKRRTEEAIALWREDVNKHPESFEANYTLGAALALQEESRAEAEALLRKAVRLKGQNARANYQLGKLLAGQGKNAEARGLLVVATTREPKYREAHYLLGMVCQKLGRAEEAKREFAIVQQLAKQDLERQIDLFDETKP